MARNLNTLDVFGKLTMYSLPGCFCAQISIRKRACLRKWLPDFVSTVFTVVILLPTLFSETFNDISDFILVWLKFCHFWTWNYSLKYCGDLSFKEKEETMLSEDRWGVMSCMSHCGCLSFFSFLWCFVNQRKSLSNAHMCIIFRIWWNKKVCNITFYVSKLAKK